MLKSAQRVVLTMSLVLYMPENCTGRQGRGPQVSLRTIQNSFNTICPAVGRPTPPQGPATALLPPASPPSRGRRGGPSRRRLGRLQGAPLSPLTASGMASRASCQWGMSALMPIQFYHRYAAFTLHNRLRDLRLPRRGVGFAAGD